MWSRTQRVLGDIFYIHIHPRYLRAFWNAPHHRVTSIFLRKKIVHIPMLNVIYLYQTTNTPFTHRYILHYIYCHSTFSRPVTIVTIGTMFGGLYFIYPHWLYGIDCVALVASPAWAPLKVARDTLAYLALTSVTLFDHCRSLKCISVSIQPLFAEGLNPPLKWRILNEMANTYNRFTLHEAHNIAAKPHKPIVPYCSQRRGLPKAFSEIYVEEVAL